MGIVQFEKISTYEDVDFALPQRKTKSSAGYDFTVPETITIPSHYSQILKLLMARFNSVEVQTDLLNSDIADILVEVGQGTISGIEEQQAAVNDIISNIPTLLSTIKSHLSLTLDEMKKLTKATDTRMTLVPTGVKAKLQENQRLELLIRSSTPLGAYITMANNLGLIDADYYNNPDNEGHIYFQLINLSPFDITLEKGDIIGQGVISEYDKVTSDDTSDERVGGLGSTD